jgi:hypothetical protein
VFWAAARPVPDSHCKSVPDHAEMLRCHLGGVKRQRSRKGWLEGNNHSPHGTYCSGQNTRPLRVFGDNAAFAFINLEMDERGRQKHSEHSHR